MQLFITTLGRVREQTTLRNLTDNLRRRTTLVVQNHEFEEYYDEWPGIPVLALPEHITNLGATRRFMHEWLRGEKFVLLDDDLTFYVRNDPSDWRLSLPDPSQLEGMFDEIEEKLDTYAHVGVSGREGNNREMRYGVENARFMRLLAYNTALFPEGVDPGRVDGMSDFDLNLQLLRRGRKSWVFYRYAQGQPGTQTPGGCSLNRTHETHEAEVDKMVLMHGNFVAKRFKENKYGGEFAKRAELTIYWKQAYEASQS